MNQRNLVILRDGVNYTRVETQPSNMNHPSSEIQGLTVNQNRGEIHSPNMNHPICVNHYLCMNQNQIENHY